MSEKSLAISCVAAAVICGTFFYPDPPATATGRVQPAQGKSVAAAPATPQFALPGNVSMTNLDAPAIANSAAKATQAATPTTRDWGARIAVISK